VLAAQLLILAAAIPFQLALLPVNAHNQWFTPGELRFWAVAVFVLLEIIYLTVT
jgi:hypothetical protein